MTDAALDMPRRKVPLNRRVAIVRPDRIDVRPSRRAILAPLVGFALGIACAVAIWFGIGTLPLWLLGVLLVVAVLAIPLAGLGTVYALVGAHVVVDRAKQSATWQQGFLGMGVGTTELVPYWKIDRLIVEEVGASPEDTGRPVEEFAQWRIVLRKKSGKRLDIAVVSVARSLSEEGLARARTVATAIAEMTGAPLDLPADTRPESVAQEPALSTSVESRQETTPRHGAQEEVRR